jgi:hypothetical protein
MGVIQRIVWRIIEILLRFQRNSSRPERRGRCSIPEDGWIKLLTLFPSEADLGMNRGTRGIAPRFQERIGFRHIRKVNLKSPSESPYPFSSNQVSLKL